MRTTLPSGPLGFWLFAVTRTRTGGQTTFKRASCGRWLPPVENHNTKATRSSSWLKGCGVLGTHQVSAMRLQDQHAHQSDTLGRRAVLRDVVLGRLSEFRADRVMESCKNSCEQSRRTLQGRLAETATLRSEPCPSAAGWGQLWVESTSARSARSSVTSVVRAYACSCPEYERTPLAEPDLGPSVAP
jgi:hypothetical protein